MSDGHDGALDHGGHGGGIGSLGAFGHSLDLGGLASGLGHSAAHSSSHSGHGHGHGHGHCSSSAGTPASGNTGWAFGFVGHAMAQMGVLDTTASCDGNSAKEGVRLPGVVCGDNTVQLLVWPHGEMHSQQLFRRIAARHGLLSLSRKSPSTVASTKTHPTLFDTKVFDGPGKNSQPSASYRDATGSTTVWTEYFQLPIRKHWYSSLDLDLGSPLPCHLIVSGYTWFFDQTGDFETRIAISVTNPKTCVAGEWKLVDEEKVRRHMAAAKVMAYEVFDEMKKAKPKSYSITIRELMVGHNNEVTFGAETSDSPAARRVVRPSPPPPKEGLIKFEMAGK